MNVAIHIVLYKPEIPANTGNIARTCAATDATLHLIHPLGFSIDEKSVKRAGLDYWSSVTIKEYDSIDQFFEQNKHGVFYFIEDYGANDYTEANLDNQEKDYYFIFGQETAGIPLQLIEGKEDFCLKIPMTDNVRSLNLSNAVAIIIYEALRQQQFKGLS